MVKAIVVRVRELLVYLAGKKRGRKWDVVDGIEGVRFVASDNTPRGWDEVRANFAGYVLREIDRCDLLVAYLDAPTSFGTIAEIAYAAAIDKPCHVLMVNPDEDFEDAYKVVCAFPGVETVTVQDEREARDTIRAIVADREQI